MRTLRSLGLITALIMSDAAFAVDDVASSVHNLTTLGPGNIRLSVIPTSPVTGVQREEICVFCHTPHHGDATVAAPLWNRAVNTGAYTMYSSPTINMVIAGSPQGVSLACLSCHDGTIAFDQLRNGPGPNDVNTATPSRGWTFQNAAASRMPNTSYAFLDTDLSNDHPVSVTYNNVAGVGGDAMFYDIPTVQAGGLRFFGAGVNQVECASCHNPHDPTNRPFLRINNDYSALCLTCHIK